MPEVKLTAELRTEFGKGAARRIRRADKVPAVLYGHGTDPIHISLPGHETLLALRAANALLSIDVNGDSQLALPKQVQRDPLKHTIEHVDLVIVRRGEKVTVDIPRAGRGRGGARDVGGGRPEHHLRRGRGDPHPAADHRVDRGSSGRHADPGPGADPAERRLAGRSTRRPLVVNVTAAQTEEQAEAELAEAEAEAGIEPTVAEDRSARPRPPRRRRRRTRATSPDGARACPPGSWSDSAILVRPIAA